MDKKAAIARLAMSPNFRTTHNAVAELLTYDDFRDDELVEVLHALDVNSQVNWILGDDDVREFADKIVSLAHKARIVDETLDSIVHQLGALDLLEEEDSSSSASSSSPLVSSALSSAVSFTSSSTSSSSSSSSSASVDNCKP